MRKLTLLAFISITLLAVSQTQAEFIKIAGNDVQDYPASGDSYWGMTPDVERAFPFTTISGGPFYVEELQVLAFYWDYYPYIQPGKDAEFTINLDNNGLPGKTIGTFVTNDIPGRPFPETAPYTPQILKIETTDDVLLDSNANYWLIGKTLGHQFNWHLGVNAYDTIAYRVDGDSWVTLYSNVTAFTITGSIIPEPATLSLLALGSLLAMRRKRS